jgi:hypothetical protein
MGVATTQGEVLPSGTFQIPGVRLGVCSVWVGIEQLDPMLPDAPLAGDQAADRLLGVGLPSPTTSRHLAVDAEVERRGESRPPEHRRTRDRRSARSMSVVSRSNSVSASDAERVSGP